jgi:hypothetical protein
MDHDRARDLELADAVQQVRHPLREVGEESFGRARPLEEPPHVALAAAQAGITWTKSANRSGE